MVAVIVVKEVSKDEVKKEHMATIRVLKQRKIVPSKAHRIGCSSRSVGEGLR